MTVYRITREQYANELTASGKAGRWNLADQYVIYASSSRSLATLELLVSTSGVYPEGSYKVMVIEIPDDFKEVLISNLRTDWRNFTSYPLLQNIGSDWYINKTDLVLSVPSAVVPQENNFLLNTQHPDFASAVRLIEVEDYFWDERL